MADLIIKPSSGNLVLKDDQNATRLTVATSTGATTLTNQVFPAGHVIQTKRIYLESTTSTDNLSYSTSSSALDGTLDSNGIYRLKNADTEYMTIPSFSATSGNLLIGWISYPGIGTPASASAYSFGIEWGSADLRTWSSQGYNNNTYTHGHFAMTSTILSSNLSSVNVHGLLRIEEINKTKKFRFTNQGVSSTNFGTEGTSAMTIDCSMTIMEIQQ